MADIDVLVQTQSNSDDSDHDANCSNSIPELKGYLSKWTNYIHGWQPRFIVLKDGTLSYYKRYFGDDAKLLSDPWNSIGAFNLICSEFESDYGCRGAISLDKATIKVNFTIRRRDGTNISNFVFYLCFCYEQSHEFDECRFDVSVNNCVWYLRAENPEDKMHWIEVLQSYKPLSGIGFDTVSLMRHGSIVSLQSNSLMANPSLGVGGLREKIAEMETFRDILSGQLNTLQRYVLRIDRCRVNKYGNV